jgi:adenosylcobinamide kinase/adenosylcobinamide-phosphate guanylyltransferase
LVHSSGKKIAPPPLTLIIGGASSGKSAFAERLVQSGLSKVYIATAEAHDDEMEAKIAEHRARSLGQGWRTVEAPLDLEQPLSNPSGEVALVDCVTFWLTNQILDDADLEEEVDVLLARLAR